MKNKPIKYILLSVALTSSLLFTACGKKSEPVNEALETTAVEETTTQDETDPTITDSERGTMEELAINLEDTSTTESTSSVDSTGSDVTIAEGDYIEPSEEEIISEERVEGEELDEAIEKAKQDMKKFYEAGIISKEGYESAMANLNNGGKKPAELVEESVPQTTYIDPHIAEINERSKKYLEEHSTGNSTDLSQKIQYGQGDYTGFEGKYIGN